MTTTTKIGVTLIVILALVVIGWLVFYSSDNGVDNKPNGVPLVSNNVTPGVNDTAAVGNGVKNSPLDTSDEAILGDINTLDEQMSKLKDDMKNIDQSLNEVTN